MPGKEKGSLLRMTKPGRSQKKKKEQRRAGEGSDSTDLITNPVLKKKEQPKAKKKGGGKIQRAQEGRDYGTCPRPKKKALKKRGDEKNRGETRNLLIKSLQGVKSDKARERG